ncbi:MAG: hypothetical protein HYZ75_18185 [Elusimicrobia bacterium]|nr:hypothetical protein [Elusimicrobiota bacterium]
MRALLLTLLLSSAAAAHEGPPYAILVDQKAGPYTVSLWGDPDVGTGTFFILVDKAGPADDTTVELFVQPASGRLPEARWEGWSETTKDGLRFVARPEFDAEERWKVRVALKGSRGAGELREDVDVTPPDLGKAGMWFYMLPFLGVGGLWAKALLKR